MLSALRSPRLRRIVAAYTVNRLGTWFGLIALMLAVFDHTHSALAVAAFLFASQALPAFVVPALVARVEASRRRSELSGLYFFEALATASLAVLLWHFWLPAVLLLAALDGTAALTATSLLRAEIARAARDDVEAELRPGSDAQGRLDQHPRPEIDVEGRAQEAERQANAALNVAFSATVVAGPVLASATVAAAGAPEALFVDVASFLICGALLLDLHPHVEEAGGESVRARLRAALKHVNEVPSLRNLLLAEAVALVFIESAGPIEVTYAKTTLHAGDKGFGLLVTSWGAGAVLGSLVFARLIRRSLSAMLGSGTAAIGLGYVGFALVPSLALACLAAGLCGVGQSLQWPSMISVVQQLTPQRLQGRLMGALESIGALCLAIGLSLGGVLVALSSPRMAFLAVGLGAVATTGALVRICHSALRPGGDEEVGGPIADSPAS